MSSTLECASSIQQYNATAQVSLPCHGQSMNRQQSNVRDTIIYIICQKKIIVPMIVECFYVQTE